MLEENSPDKRPQSPDFVGYSVEGHCLQFFHVDFFFIESVDYFSSLVLDFHRALIFKSFPVKQPLNDLVACLLRLGHVNHYDLLFVDDLVSCLEELLIDLLRLPVVFLDLL